MNYVRSGDKKKGRELNIEHSEVKTRHQQSVSDKGVYE